MLAALAALDVDPQDASSVLIEPDAVTITRRIPILGGGDDV